MLVQFGCRLFRNLEIPRWCPDPGTHLILGPNGAGKTSLLEAVYLLATTRSFRTSRVLDCARHDGEEFHLEAEVGGERRTRLSLGSSAGQGRFRAVNDSDTSLVEHLRVLPVVAWTAADKEVLSGPPAHRRRFLDQGIVACRPVALEVLTRFRRALAQKRELLLGDPRGLSSWNEVLAASASELMTLRQDYVDQLTLALRQIARSLDFDLPEVTLEFRPSIQTDLEDPAAALAALEKVERQERREKRPLIGPQRDDLSIRLGGHGIRRVGSAGERKIVGLLLTAARGRVLERLDRPPLYLLDDADSELDRERLAAIWRAFRGTGQTFVTSSRTEVWSVAGEATRWRLEGGRLGLESKS